VSKKKLASEADINVKIIMKKVAIYTGLLGQWHLRCCDELDM
jgi:hypothetical protein